MYASAFPLFLVAIPGIVRARRIGLAADGLKVLDPKRPLEKRTSPAENALTDIKHEIELASETIAGVCYPHQQFVPKQAITQRRSTR
jgi:hypothetical protein